MIDLGLLRNQPERIISLIEKKDPSFDGKKMLELDAQVRTIRLEVESLRQRKNELAQQAKSGVTPEIRQESIEVSKKLKDQEQVLADVEKAFMELYLSCPNIVEEDLPVGGKEAKPGDKTKGKSKQYEKQGGFEEALEDFESLKLINLREIPNGKAGNLLDGRTVNVRTGSTDKRPTLEIYNPKNKNSIKIRYGDKL